jgi:redox-sensitive bicupin YhaK (pirin superfamily)
MITLRRANERHLDQVRKQEVWLTFEPQERASSIDGDFWALRSFSENLLPPGGVSVVRPSREAEIVTYIYRGALAQQDSTGSSGVVHAGEFQRMAIGRGIRHKETNASRTHWAHIFRISLRPSEVGSNRAHEQMRFAAAERRNVLCIVASSDGRQGSLCIRQDALVCSSVLDPGRHLVHELLPGRSAWLHVICGEAASHDVILCNGDGVGVTTERSVSLTALEQTEILLVDLGEQGRLPPGN